MDKMFESIRNSTNYYSKKISTNKYTQIINKQEVITDTDTKYYNSINVCVKFTTTKNIIIFNIQIKV